MLLLSHVPLEMLILALVVGGCQAWGLKDWKSRWDVGVRWILLAPVGIAGFWGAFFHAFAPEMAASFIGWTVSPFQYEVAAANLGLGLVGVVGFRTRNQGQYWIAATLMTCCFLWGAAATHVAQMVKAGNFAPGNAGAIFYTDLLIPIILLVMVIGWHRSGRTASP